jgi:hypothetical protein
MTQANFSVFGMGADHLHYIGWTERSLNDEREILADLTRCGTHDVAHWAAQAIEGGKISIFEIEMAPSAAVARDAVQFWCQYYGMLGAKVDAAQS